MGPVRLSDVEKSQQTIVRIAKRLEDEGKIVIARGGGGDVFL
jgi:flagellar motor switch protein FliG